MRGLDQATLFPCVLESLSSFLVAVCSVHKWGDLFSLNRPLWPKESASRYQTSQKVHLRLLLSSLGGWTPSSFILNESSGDDDGNDDDNDDYSSTSSSSSSSFLKYYFRVLFMVSPCGSSAPFFFFLVFSAHFVIIELCWHICSKSALTSHWILYFRQVL